MQEVYNGIWREIASRIRPHLSTDAFQRWFAAIELVEADEAALTLRVPNSIYQFWIESNYLNVVESAVRSVLGIRAIGLKRLWWERITTSPTPLLWRFPKARPKPITRFLFTEA